MDFYDICDVRGLAIAIIEKCQIGERKGYFDGERQMPWNVVPVFGGGPPKTTGPENGDGSGNWHGRNYNFLAPVESYEDLVKVTDVI